MMFNDEFVAKHRKAATPVYDACMHSIVFNLLTLLSASSLLSSNKIAFFTASMYKIGADLYMP